MGEVPMEKFNAAAADLASRVAHDIRSPLAALDSLTEDAGRLPEEQRALWRCAVERIRDIANELAENSRRFNSEAPEPAGSDEPASVVLLSGLVDPLISRLRAKFRTKTRVEISGGGGAYGLFVRVQTAEFQRVLEVLISRRVEALGGNGTVKAGLAARNGRAVIEIQDDGKGILPEMLSGKDPSGPGLLDARDAFESWGGSLEVGSGLGRGTLLTLRLPLAQAPGWFVTRLELQEGRTVAVIDDDPGILQMWRNRFEALGAGENGVEVLYFSAPAELRRWALGDPGKARSALFLTDLEISGHEESGLDLVAELGAGERAILVSSRFEEESVRERCVRLGTRMIPKGSASAVPVEFVKSRRGPDAVLVDDDALAHLTWGLSAKAKGVRLLGFRTPREFLAALESIPKGTPIYLDCELGGGARGDAIAKDLHSRGYTELILATGHDPAGFPPMPWIRRVTDKTPPWDE
jgi:hypothetical protein